MRLLASAPRFGLVGVAATLIHLTVAIAWGVDAAGGHYLVGIGITVMLIPVLTLVAQQKITYR